MLNPQSLTVRAACKDVWLEGGWRGFFSGLQPRLARVPPGCAIVVASYELFKQFLAAEK